MPNPKDMAQAHKEMLQAVNMVLKLAPPTERIPMTSKLDNAIREFKEAAQDYFRAAWDI